MTFQPWKQAFNNLPNQFYRNVNNKSDSSELASTFGNGSKMKNGDTEISGGPSVSNLNILSHQYELSNDSQQQHYQSSLASTNSTTTTNNNIINNNNNSNALTQIESEQQQQAAANKNPLNGTKFSIFSQLINLNKINAFDNLLLNASMSLDDDDFHGDKRQGMRKLMEQAIR